MNTTNSLQLSVPLNHEAHEMARRFAAEQTNLAKGKQVYLNTLAVYAVHTYLKWLEVETDLTQADSWQPGLRTLFNVADLVIPRIGTLECCPVLPGETVAVVPAEVAGERIGYVAVQFNQQLDSVELLGFVRDSFDPVNQPLETQSIPVTEFLSMGLDPLLNILYPEDAAVVLRDWLENNFKHTEWQAPELLVADRFRSLTAGSRAVRGGSQPPEMFSQLSAVSRAKTFQVGQLPEQAVVLVVQVSSITTDKSSLSVKLRFYPSDTSDCLPESLKVAVLDQSGSIILESQPKEETIWTELELLDCHPDERFLVRISIEESVLTEEFCV